MRIRRSRTDTDQPRVRPRLNWLMAPAWLLLIVVGATMYEVISRYLFLSPTIWANELSLMLSSIVFVTSGVYTIFRREHLRITVLYDLAGPRLRLVFDAVHLAVVQIFCGAIVIYGYPSAWRALTTWELYGTAWNPPIPALIQPLIVICAFTMAIIAIRNFILGRRGRGQGPSVPTENT